MPHPWTRPTYDAKRHRDPICRFSTMHWTDRPTDRSRETVMTIGRCAPRAMWPNNMMLSGQRTKSLTWIQDQLSSTPQMRHNGKCLDAVGEFKDV